MSPRLKTDAKQTGHLSQINKAALWLAEHEEGAFPGPLTATLRERWGLGFNDACKAIAEARRLRAIPSSRQ